MSAATAYPPIREILNGSDRAVLRDVPWDAYVAMRDDETNRHVRMNYFRGTLELMSPKYRHEKYSRRLDHLVWELALGLGIPHLGAGSTTFRRQADSVGIEADTCFYLASVPLVRGKVELDPSIDPPPDLAIELDNFGDSEVKLPAYAVLRVPEVWRYDVTSGALWFGRLQADGTYRSIERSEALPPLTPQLILEALAFGEGMDDSEWGLLLREWVRGLAAAPVLPGKPARKSKPKAKRPTPPGSDVSQ